MKSNCSCVKVICELTLGYICDRDVGFLPSDRIFVVPEDHQCPSFEGWPLSCDFLAASNEIVEGAEPESESATVMLCYFDTLIYL